MLLGWSPPPQNLTPKPQHRSCSSLSRHEKLVYLLLRNCMSSEWTTAMLCWLERLIPRQSSRTAISAENWCVLVSGARQFYCITQSMTFSTTRRHFYRTNDLRVLVWWCKCMQHAALRLCICLWKLYTGEKCSRSSFGCLLHQLDVINTAKSIGYWYGADSIVNYVWARCVKHSACRDLSLHV